MILLLVILAGKSCGDQTFRVEFHPFSARAKVMQKVNNFGQILAPCKGKIPGRNMVAVGQKFGITERDFLTETARSR